MLAALAKEHNTNQAIRRNQLEKKRAIALESTNKFSQYLIDRLNKEVSEAFVNQKRIDSKIKQINQNSAQFIKNSQQWIQLLENFNTSLKVGSLETLRIGREKIETDMKIINLTLNEITSMKDEN